MTTTAVIEHFDVLEQIGDGRLARAVALPMHALILQAVEKALGRGVDAPMSSKPLRVRQVSEDQRIQRPDDVALQASVNFLV